MRLAFLLLALPWILVAAHARAVEVTSVHAFEPIVGGYPSSEAWGSGLATVEPYPPPHRLLVVGDPGDDLSGTNRGALWLLELDRRGALLSRTRLALGENGVPGALDDGDSFGRSVTSLGDLDGDGVGDLAVGAFGDDDGDLENGAVWVLFLNADRSVKRVQKISSLTGGLAGQIAPHSRFGAAVAGLGDLDGDGVPDLAVGASSDPYGAYSPGAVFILFLRPDGTVRSYRKFNPAAEGVPGFNSSAGLGTSAGALGDVDGDGTTDLAVGSYNSSTDLELRGAVWILFLKPDGTVKAEREIGNSAGGFVGTLEPGDEFAVVSVAGLGDRNGDGTPDLAVGAPGVDHYDAHSDNAGAIFILFLNPDGSVRAQGRIETFEAGFDASTVKLGAVAPLWDLNGDGILDLLVGELAVPRLWKLWLGSCADGADNDGDGLTDYPEDPGCDSPDDPSEWSPALVCDNGLDDDGDGLSDAADPGCSSATDDSEQDPSLVCDDGIDNDGDGWVDAVQDPGCLDPTSPLEDPECDDGIDNDGDGRIDAYEDIGCNHQFWRNDETSQCDDGIDNDGDGRTDFADPGCLESQFYESRPHCGLGWELVLLIGLRPWLRRRAERASRKA